MPRKEPLRTIKGMRDILPPESALWNHIEQVAREVFRSYAYDEIRTPLVERTELFARGVGQDTDIVTKEMYSFEDRDGQSLTLRPEATASVVRSYIEHGLHNEPGLNRFFYLGPMFRRERPQKGRYRQFYQIGAEAIGSESSNVDAEMISVAIKLLKDLDVTGSSLWLNSVGCPVCRPKYLETLRKELGTVRGQLCEDCQRRSETNPLRVLDCKVPQDQPIIEKLPAIAELLCEDCKKHFSDLQSSLHVYGIDFTLQPRLVRGLDYYTRTTFEVVHGGLGAQNSLLGGGRYDGLSEALGGPPVPGVGFSIGEDRLASVVPPLGKEPYLSIAWIGEIGGLAHQHATNLAMELRQRKLLRWVKLESQRPKKAYEVADRLSDRYHVYVLIVGDQEANKGSYEVKDMTTKEKLVKTREELAQFLEEKVSQSQ